MRSIGICLHLGVLPAVVVLFANVARAERTDPPSLTAQQLIERLDRSPRVAVLRARVDVARAEIAAARVLPNPAISYERESVSSGGAARPEDYVRAMLPLDVSGRRGRRVAAAEAGSAAVAADTERELLLLRLDALALFYDVAHVRLQADLLRADRNELAAIVARLRARAKAGDASGYDVTRIEIELGEHDDRLADADRELLVARRSLGLLVGHAGPVDATDTLAVERARADPAAEPRADLRAARLRGRQGEAEAAAGSRAWVPTLELSGGLKSVRDGDTRANGYLAGLALRLPLFDRGQAERARGEARRRGAEAESRLLEATVAVEVANAHDAHQRIVAQAVGFRDVDVPRAETLVRRADGLYREGERPVFELIDAHRTARQVRLRGLELRRRAKQSALDLWRALGRMP